MYLMSEIFHKRASIKSNLAHKFLIGFENKYRVLQSAVKVMLLLNSYDDILDIYITPDATPWRKCSG
jgi:hypothetical protein